MLLRKIHVEEKLEEADRTRAVENPVSKKMNMKLPKLEIKKFSGHPKLYK